MNTNRVNVLHVADCDAVSCAVTHYFIFNFFPSCDAALYQNFTYTRKTETILQDFTEFIFIMGDTAAASTECVSRTENYRIADGICKCKTIFYCCNNLGCCDRLTDLLHGIFKFLTVLCFLDGQSCGTDQSYIVFFQETFLIQLHGKV